MPPVPNPRHYHLARKAARSIDALDKWPISGQTMFLLLQKRAHFFRITLGGLMSYKLRAWRDSNPQPSDPKSEERSIEGCFSLVAWRIESQVSANFTCFRGDKGDNG